MRELTLEATIENVEAVTQFVEEQLEEVECSAKARMQINLAIDELFSNIANYAYNPETGPATVRVEVTKEPLEVLITFIDEGVAYDPLAKDDPDITLSAEERKIGGLGIFLVKKNMDEVSYEYKNGRNVLSIRKGLGLKG
jgi:anti-sigma regulatory factor (Ser/Thr protein kinase)